MVQVYARPYCQRHYAGIFSEASVFITLGHIATIIMTLVVVIGCGGLWKQLDYKTEQPLATASTEAIMVLEGPSLVDSVIWSTHPVLNAMFPQQMAGVNFQVAHVDHNDDGKPDEIKIKALVKTFTAINSVKILLQLRYQLTSTTKLDMYSLAYVDESSANSASGLLVTGELKLQQMNPLTRFGQTWYGPILDFAPSHSPAAPWPEETILQLPRLMKAYMARNETTTFVHTDSFWQTGRTGRFELDMTIKIPTHQVVMRRPQVLEELKHGWIQFVAVYWIFWSVFKGFQWVVFHSRIVDTHVVSDLQRKPRHF